MSKKTPKNKVILVILDGYAKGPDNDTNAIYLANTPTLDKLEKTVPHTLLKADSEAVGLPANTLGGSEVGHSTIGAGRVIYQTLEMINQEIKSGQFYDHKPFKTACQITKDNDSTLHLVGMISDGGIHSHINHLYALLEMAKKNKVKKVAIHAIADGRDVPEKSVYNYLKQIDQKIKEIGLGQVVDLIGRYYAMDRDTNWSRTETAYKLYTLGEGKLIENTKEDLLTQYNQEENTDYYLKAKKFTDNQDALIKSEDSVIFFNFRTDRSKQLTDAFTLTEFNHFKTELSPLPYFVCFGQYSDVAPVIFSPVLIENNLGETIAKSGLKQLRIAETEKYPHVTFFLNSQKKEPCQNESRVMIDSPKVASYAEKPEMSAYEINQKLVPTVQSEVYDFIAVNYANMDLVGHSGNLKATIKAVQVVDECLGQLLEVAKTHNYSVIITGDHGNADEMIFTTGDSKGECSPAHSFNPTQCFVITKEIDQLRKGDHHMHDIAPTILKLMDIKKPKEMSGESLV
jgi:2,3-bisphosphoglycerate-independent phosphoglycerate mutase